MLNFFMSLIIIYYLPYILLGMALIAALIGLLMGIYERSIEEYARKHTGFRDDKDDR